MLALTDRLERTLAAHLVRFTSIDLSDASLHPEIRGDDRAFVTALQVKTDGEYISNAITQNDSDNSTITFCTLAQTVLLIPNVTAEKLGLYVSYDVSSDPGNYGLSGGDSLPWIDNDITVSALCSNRSALNLWQDMLDEFHEAWRSDASVVDSQVLTDTAGPYEPDKSMFTATRIFQTTTLEN